MLLFMVPNPVWIPIPDPGPDSMCPGIGTVHVIFLGLCEFVQISKSFDLNNFCQLVFSRQVFVL